MSTIIIFFLEIIFLFLLSQSFSRSFFKFWILLTTSKTLALWVSAIFLLPGTIIHELSHWLVAEILQVPTGEFSFTPEIIEGQGVKMASVQIGKVDPFCRTIIGLAPLFIGISLLFLAAHFLSLTAFFNAFLLNTILLYGMFTVSNTMFSSKKDLEVMFVPALLVAIAALGLWFFNLSIPIQVIYFVNSLLERINPALSLVIVIDIVVMLLVTLLTTLSGKVLHRRIVRIKT